MKRVVEVLVGLGYNGREQGWEAACGLCCACAAVGRSLPRMCFVCRAKGCLLAGPAALNSLTRLLWHRGCGTDLHKAPRGHFQLRRQLWAGREGLSVMPAPLFLSLAATAQLSQHSPALQECGMPFFFPHIFFPWNTALLQSIPCSFPRSCSSYDLLSSKKMRCPHPKQCLYTWDPALPPSLWLIQSHCQIWLPDIYHRLCWNSFPFTFHLSEDD